MLLVYEVGSTRLGAPSIDTTFVADGTSALIDDIRASAEHDRAAFVACRDAVGGLNAALRVSACTGTKANMHVRRRLDRP